MGSCEIGWQAFGLLSFFAHLPTEASGLKDLATVLQGLQKLFAKVTQPQHSQNVRLPSRPLSSIMDSEKCHLGTASQRHALKCSPWMRESQSARAMPACPLDSHWQQSIHKAVSQRRCQSETGESFKDIESPDSRLLPGTECRALCLHSCPHMQQTAQNLPIPMNGQKFDEATPSRLC